MEKTFDSGKNSVAELVLLLTAVMVNTTLMFGTAELVKFTEYLYL